MIAIFTFEMSFVRCVLSDHYVFLLQLLHSTMHTYLQNRCTNFSKKRIKKNFTLWRGERVSFISEEKDTMLILQDNIFCNWTNMFATPSFCWILHELLLFILYLDSYQTCFYFFYSCYCTIYKNTLECFLDEINFFRAMPKYDVMFIINPIWHCSLSEKRCVKICCGIPCEIVMWH